MQRGEFSSAEREAPDKTFDGGTSKYLHSKSEFVFRASNFCVFSRREGIAYLETANSVHPPKEVTLYVTSP
jgi:hypothetical protein